MKLNQILKFNTSFLLSIAAIPLVANTIRNPFEFELETIQEVKTEPVEPRANLDKWDIKEIDNDFIIMENVEGQIRTIRVSSFI